MREFRGKHRSDGDASPLRRAYALSYAMSARPTPALASLYFETLRKMLDPDDPERREPQEEKGSTQ